MRPPHRREAGSVIARLLAAPHGFEFVQAVRLLLGWMAQHGTPPRQALRERLRFENSLRLGFPAGEIESLRCIDPERDGGSGPLARLHLTPSFMGLLGVQGALPVHVTERIAGWQAEHGDEAPRAFLDMLSGRMLALYYDAWFKYRIEEPADGAPDRLRAILLALAGCAGDAPAAAGVPENLIAHFAGLLQGRPVTGVVLERLLASYFDVGVVVDETVGHWARLQPGEQSAIGSASWLGRNASLGERSWRPDLRARLRIGPLDRGAFERFLPSGEAAAMLRAILRLLAPPTVDFEVQLILRAADVGRSRLGAGGTAARLGRDSFVLGGPARADRADLRYLVTPMAPLAPRVSKKVQGDS